MKQYLELLEHVLENGEEQTDRTGVGTLSVFGAQARYDLREGFPLVTTKKVFWRGVVEELLWFISGDTNSKTLEAKGVNIWKPWARPDGELGPIYGKQWRDWLVKDYYQWSIDQLQDVIESIHFTTSRKLPPSRRWIVSAWNVAELDVMALPPCHVMFQFYVSKGRLSCHLYQRSGDAAIGVPFNIASYALLTHMVAQVCGLEVGEFIHSFGDLHLYTNHIEQAKEQLSREPRALPKLKLNPSIYDIDDFTTDDIHLLDYNPHPAIKAEVAV